MNWQIIDTVDFYHAMLFFGAITLICFTLAYPMVTKCSIERLGILTRTPFIGVPFAVLATWWVIPHAAILLNYVDSPNDGYILLPYAAIICALCCIFLDFLAARAFAGVAILFCYTGVNGAFIYTEPKFAYWSHLFILLTLLFAIFVIFIAAKPYQLRDILYKLGHTLPKWIFIFVWVLLALFAVSTTFLYLTTYYVK